jgi:hypothetical protein
VLPGEVIRQMLGLLRLACITAPHHTGPYTAVGAQAKVVVDVAAVPEVLALCCAGGTPA